MWTTGIQQLSLIFPYNGPTHVLRPRISRFIKLSKIKRVKIRFEYTSGYPNADPKYVEKQGHLKSLRDALRINILNTQYNLLHHGMHRTIRSPGLNQSLLANQLLLRYCLCPWHISNVGRGPCSCTLIILWHHTSRECITSQELMTGFGYSRSIIRQLSVIYLLGMTTNRFVLDYHVTKWVLAF